MKKIMLIAIGCIGALIITDMAAMFRAYQGGGFYLQRNGHKVVRRGFSTKSNEVNIEVIKKRAREY